MNPANHPDELNQQDLAHLVVDMIHRIIVHHVFWFKEVEHQFGFPKALEIMGTAFDQSYEIQIARLAKVLDFELVEGIPKALSDMPREKQFELLKSLGTNWLANDGVWFQAVEFNMGMYDAKRCNDTCWSRFSKFEAWSIKRFLGLPEQAGLEGLKKALNFRMYSWINKQAIIEEEQDSLIFQMTDCRVQSARKRKGLEDYPCKSAGVVEYREFGSAIDSRINVECLGCPPDEHPENWWCAWRFTLNEQPV